MVLQSWEGAQVSYLTPSKIVLLSICALYCEGEIAYEDRISVMNWIVKWIDRRLRMSGDNTMERSPSVWMGLEMSEIKEILGGSDSKLYKTILTRLWKWESLDGLFNFFTELNVYLEKPIKELEKRRDENGEVIGHPKVILKLHPKSLLGIFFSKCYLAFERLEFDKLIELWRDFERFREETREEWERNHIAIYEKAEGEENYDTVNAEANDSDELSSNPSFLIPRTPEEEDASEKCIPALTYLIDEDRLEGTMKSQSINISDETVEAIFEHQIDQFQQHGVILPKNIISVMETLINSRSSNRPLPPSAYFVQYLDACRNRDHEKAFENLHRFYDYSMDSRGRSHYQYALFTLATLQAEFNATSEAIRAAQEAIAVAHENMDFSCLTQLLSWLYTYLQNNPDVDIPTSLTSKDQIAQFLLAKSWETSPSITSLSFQSDVLRVLSTGGDSDSGSNSTSFLTGVFESLIKSAYINIATNSPLMTANLQLIQSVLWNRLGSDTLSDLYLEMCLSTTSCNNIPATLSSRNHGGNASTYLQAAVIKSHKLLSQGHIAQSFELLNSLKPLAEQSIAYQQIWLPNALLLHIRQALNENRLLQARTLINRLSGLFLVNQSIVHATRAADIELDILMGNKSEAVEKSTKEVQNCGQVDVDILCRLKYMILYVRVLIKSRQPTRAFSVTLRCFQIAQRAMILPIGLESLLLLSTILNSRGDYRDSISILDGIVPKVGSFLPPAAGLRPDPLLAPLVTLLTSTGS